MSKRFRPKGFIPPPGRVRLAHEPVTFRVSHKHLYDEYPHHYARLASRQDKDAHIALHLRKSGLFEANTHVLELGAGAGKLSCLIAPWVKHVTVTDVSQVMLELAATNLGMVGVCEDRWTVERHDITGEWGYGDGLYDVVLAGWCVSYVKSAVSIMCVRLNLPPVSFRHSFRHVSGMGLAYMEERARPSVHGNQTCGEARRAHCTPRNPGLCNGPTYTPRRVVFHVPTGQPLCTRMVQD